MLKGLPKRQETFLKLSKLVMLKKAFSIRTSLLKLIFRKMLKSLVISANRYIMCNNCYLMMTINKWVIYYKIVTNRLLWLAKKFPYLNFCHWSITKNLFPLFRLGWKQKKIKIGKQPHDCFFFIWAFFLNQPPIVFCCFF